MEPVAILSLVCNICQLCEYGAKALVKAKEVYDSKTGMVVEHEKLQSSTRSLTALVGRLQVAKPAQSQTEDEKNLHGLALKCTEVSGRILELLEWIKSKKARSLKNTMGVVWRGGRKKGKLKELQEELGQLRVQVQLQLEVLMRSEMLDQFEELIKSGQSNAAELATLHENIQTLRAGVQVTAFGPEVSTQLHGLLDLSSTAMDRKCRQCILRGISFPNMNKRYQEVDTAHHATFTWILDQPREPEVVQRSEEDESRDSTRRCFRSWLSEGKGIFQFSAKPGAGKSTMMKFICSSQETSNLLKTWAGEKRLIMAKFFFWKQDDPQRSLDGMMRTLLQEILTGAPELIAHVLPDQWKLIQSIPWHAQLVPEFTNIELRQAFERLFSDPNVNIFQTRKMCIFLDGLDEFVGKKGHEELVDYIHRLVGISDDIKFCVSSRVMNSLTPIDDAYPQQKIYLHQLTEVDIRRVVHDELNGHQNFKKMRLENSNGCEKLISNVVDKAQGVFLWVTLILNILRRGLTDGDIISDLIRKTNCCPEELDDFLREIIRSIPAENRKLAYQIFAVATMLAQYGHSMRLLNYSFLEDYDLNHKFAIELPNDCILSSEETTNRLTRTRIRIVAHCKGLLQASDEPHGGYTPSVSFIHRSAREIFEQEQVKIEMAKYLQNFDIMDAILQTQLAGIKREPAIIYSDRKSTRKLGYVLANLVLFIKSVSSQYTTATFKSLDKISTALLSRQEIAAESFHEVEWSRYDVQSGFRAPTPVRSRIKIDSFVHIAAEHCFVAYLEWTVNKFPNFVNYHGAATELLDLYICERPVTWSQKGAIWIESLFLRGLSANSPRYLLVAAGSGQPIWSRLLDTLLIGQRSLSSRPQYWEIFELFLKYGADCSVTMELYDRASKIQKVRWASRISDKNRHYIIVSDLFKNLNLDILGLQDVVDFYAPKNADTIKKLIARNQARERESPSIITLSNQDFENSDWKKNPETTKWKIREPNWDVSPPTASELKESKKAAAAKTPNNNINSTPRQYPRIPNDSSFSPTKNPNLPPITQPPASLPLWSKGQHIFSGFSIPVSVLAFGILGLVGATYCTEWLYLIFGG